MVNFNLATGPQEAFKKFNLRLLIEEFQQSGFKRAYVIFHYSYCTYINNEDKFIESTLILPTNQS